MKQYFTKLRKMANNRMFDGASAFGIIAASGGLKFALIVAVLLLVYFALKKLQEIKQEKEAAAEAASMRLVMEEDLDDEDKTE